MKIAHVVATFPPRLGGMGAVALDECQGLASSGHAVTVFTLDYGDSIKENHSQPFQVVRLRSFLRSGDAGSVPQLAPRLKNFDLVHLHYPWYGGAEWVWLAKILHQQPYILTYHMDAAPTMWRRQVVRWIYDRLFSRTIIRGAKRVLVVNYAHAFQSRLNKMLNPDKMVEIPNGIDTNVFRPANVALSDVGLSDWMNKKILLFVGNLLPIKRLDLLLEALKNISDENVVLAVVGGGYAEAEYKKMTKDLGLESRVRFVGPCHDRKKLSAYYNIATCLVVPSDAESYSLVVGEALASGCPVVASALPELKNRIDKERLFTPGDSASLRERLEAILNLTVEERRAFGVLGRERIMKQYSLSEHLANLEKIYQEAIHAA